MKLKGSTDVNEARFVELPKFRLGPSYVILYLLYDLPSITFVKKNSTSMIKTKSNY